ncbi:MAG: multidrug effflux MFS transporter [Proteobacteria bacterium]|nr:multidrug effflux MFS transporter [Pseudomonadota bacterium]HQR04455.1 multidrug effflux MFS transporter [Rhodocyclaceae bacterium]
MRNEAAPRGIAILLATLSAIGPFSIDTYLPAFPSIARSLGASQIEVQQTLTAYLLSFAFMTLWHGALADALGRRRVILAGLACYTLASLFCLFATRIELLWLGRVLQGLSAGVGMVVGRAMVRDLFDGAAAQRLMARVGVIFAVAPAIAPVIGGWVYTFFGWQGIFAFLTLFGAGLWFACWRALPETLAADMRQNLHPVALWHGYSSVLRSAPFLGLSFALALNFNGLFIYVLSAPVFLIEHLHLTPQSFAWLYVPAVAGMMLGNILSARAAGRFTPHQTILAGFCLMALAAAVNIALNLHHTPGLLQAVLPIGLYDVGMALAMASLQILALDLFPDRRGMASSCQGLLQTGTNALTAGVVAPLVWSSTLTLAATMGAFVGLGFIAFLAARKQR